MPLDKPQTSVDEIMAGIAAALPNLTVFHNQVLVGIYMREGTTKGGIILPDKVKDEDRWQGKVGLVLQVGPMAFVNDARNDFKNQKVDIGEWVLFRVSDGFPLDINGMHCRLVEDIHIKGRVSTPDIIW